MTPEQKRQLDEAGYLVLEDFASLEFLKELRDRIDALFTAEGEAAGSEFRQEPQTRRLANLIDKGEIFRRAIAVPELLEAVRCVIGPEFKLSSLNARSADPYSTWVQPLHADVGAIADEAGNWVCNIVWMLDDFTEDNGATRMVPGSHRWRKLPQDVLNDPAAPHPDEILLTGRAGTVVVMNAHMWHGGTANRTGQPRRALHSFYTRRDKPQQQYQKALLRPGTQAALGPELRWLLALDDPLNDELCARTTGMSGFLR